jgi:hypothetical protein
MKPGGLEETIYNSILTLKGETVIGRRDAAGRLSIDAPPDSLEEVTEYCMVLIHAYDVMLRRLARELDEILSK